MPVYSLGPPQSARKVLTEKEFFAQMERAKLESTKSLEDRVVPEPRKPRSKKLKGSKSQLSDKPNAAPADITLTFHKPRLSNSPVQKSRVKNLQNVRLGEYGVEDILVRRSGFDFINFVTPVGFFSSVFLPKKFHGLESLAVRGNVTRLRKEYLHNQAQWCDCNAKTPNPTHDYLMPSWFYYGLMKSAYKLAMDSYSPISVSAAKQVAKFFQSVQQVRCWSTSTEVVYRPGQRVRINHGLGIQNRALAGAYLLPFAGADGFVSSSADLDIKEAIHGLFFEVGMDDFCKTLSWAFGSADTHIVTKPKTFQGCCDVHFSYGLNQALVDTFIMADQDPREDRYALFVRANLNFFKPY